MARARKSFTVLFLASGLLALSVNSGAQESPGKAQQEKPAKAEKSAKEMVTAQLSGEQQVPAVQTKASGKSTIRVDENKSISGKVMVQDMTATAAHIHQGTPDKDGPVVIPLEQTSDNIFRVAPGTKLTDAQFAAFKEGNLYINVHSKKYPSGEIRAQMKP